MINLDHWHWPGETRGSGHINRSRVNQDLFYINPSLSLEAAEQRISLILSKVYKERSFHRELVSPDFLVPVTSSLSATGTGGPALSLSRLTH